MGPIPDPVLSTVQHEWTFFTLSEGVICVGGKQTLKRASDVTYQQLIHNKKKHKRHPGGRGWHLSGNGSIRSSMPCFLLKVALDKEGGVKGQGREI